MVSELFFELGKTVALFTRAWIEMLVAQASQLANDSRPLYEGVD